MVEAMKTTVALAINLLCLLSAAGAPVRDGPVVAELLADVDRIAPGQSFSVALRLRLDAPWHAYWINPGDSGLAPSIEWTLPEGFTVSELLHPAPHSIPTPPFMTYGHEGEVLLLATVQPPPDLAADSVVLSAEADWLVCHDVCVPGYAELRLVLPVQPSPNTPTAANSQIFADARSRMPRDPEGWTFSATRHGTSFKLQASPPPGFGIIESAEFFPLAQGLIRHAAPQAHTIADGGVSLELVPADPSAPPPERLAGVLAVLANGLRIALLVDAPFSEASRPRLSNPERTMP